MDEHRVIDVKVAEEFSKTLGASFSLEETLAIMEIISNRMLKFPSGLSINDFSNAEEWFSVEDAAHVMTQLAGTLDPIRLKSKYWMRHYEYGPTFYQTVERMRAAMLEKGIEVIEY